MKTKKPSAIVYGWHFQGNHILHSDVYFEENLEDEVQVFSLPYTNQVFDDYSKYEPDLIISIIDPIKINDPKLNSIHVHLDEVYSDNVLANVIVCQSVSETANIIDPSFLYSHQPIKLAIEYSEHMKV